MKKLLLIFVFAVVCLSNYNFIFTLPLFAQYVDTAWVKRYNGPVNSNDYANAIAVDGSGNVYVTGRSYGSGTDYDYATVKYYPDGDTAWVRRYNGPGNAYDEAYAIAVDSSGNLYVTGWSYGSVTSYDYATIKYYPNGDTAWVRRYTGPGNNIDGANALAVDSSGNLYVTGESCIGMDRDYATIKYYPNGDTAWVRIYNGPDNFYDYAYAIAVDGSGNLYVTGCSYGIGTSRDYATIKYYPNGDTAWVRRYNGPGNAYDEAYAIAVDSSGNLYVTGLSYSSTTNYDFATIKYKPNGDTVWVRRYNNSDINSEDKAYNLCIDASGNVYVSGHSIGNGTNWDITIIKYYADGDTAWVRRYNGPGNGYDEAKDITVDSSGNVYVIGESYGGSTLADYATIKYYFNGDSAWVKRYDGGHNGYENYLIDLQGQLDSPQAIELDGSNNVYITGCSWGTEEDYATIKYIQFDSIPFAPVVDYWVGGRDPASVFCADLDGDMDLDLAVSNADDDNVSILNNNGDGTFQNADNYGAGDAPYSIFCADLDGDGDLDLATANYNGNNVSILINNGDGIFQSAVNYSVGVRPRSVFGGDLDGDTDIDLVTANAFDVNGSILKNNGDGTFQSAVNYPGGSGPWSVICADLDGDFDLDLAVANAYGDNVSILKNNGDGVFPTKVDYGVGDTPFHIFCADLDGDFDLDLAVANEVSDDVSILKNNGDGTFQPAVNYGAENEAVSTFCADLDGDNDLDLAVANLSSTNVSILKNNGDGTFQNATNYGTGHANYYVFCGDLDGDTDLDLAVAKIYSDFLSILKNLTQAPANQPPWAFSLISPLDGDTTFGTMTFRWRSAYDPNFGDQIRYDLYLSTVSGFDPDSTVVYDSLPLAKFADTLNNDTYYWKVKAYDNWGAVRWSTQSWSFVVASIPETLWYFAYSPVDLIVTAPNGDSIGVDFNTIPFATYDTTIDRNGDLDLDDIVTIPNPIVGEYTVKVKSEPGADTGYYSLTIKLDNNEDKPLAQNLPIPPPDQVDTYTYPVIEYLRGDANTDKKTTVSDVVFLINYLFKGGPAPNPVYLGDVNCDDKVNVTDVIYLINYLFKGGLAPCS